MCKHENKNCPKCNAIFECKAGNITQCQCYPIKFSEAQRAYAEEKFDNCLCNNCLLLLRDEFEYFKEKFIIKYPVCKGRLPF